MDTIESFAPWFYEFDLGPLGQTTSALPRDVRPIHSTRLEMMNTAIDSHFSSERLAKARCLDVGCHEGFYSVALAKRPVREVLGVDVRTDSLQRANFVPRAMGLKERAVSRIERRAG